MSIKNTCKVCGLYTQQGNYTKIKSSRGGTEVIICHSCKDDINIIKKYVCSACGFSEDVDNLFYEIEKPNGQTKVVCILCLGKLREDKKKMDGFLAK